MQLRYYMAIALSKCLFKCFVNVFNLLIDFNFSGIVLEMHAGLINMDQVYRMHNKSLS